MNHHDSERILSHLMELNFTRTDELENADMVLFNTCAVRELSNNKFYSQLGQIKNAKKKKSRLGGWSRWLCGPDPKGRS